MKIIFAGTPDFSLPALQMLLLGQHPLVAVYTQPDRPAGRGRKLTASPVKQLAKKNNIHVYQPYKLSDDEVLDNLCRLKPDLMIVVAYGLLLPQAVLDLPRLGCINIHASLLPRWRGAAPIQRAIIAGDHETGVSLMQMEAGLDSGPVLASQRCAIHLNETGGQLHDRLAGMGAGLLKKNLEGIETGHLVSCQQDESRVTYAKKIEKQEAVIDWQHDAAAIARQVAAYNPWPVAETAREGECLRIWEASVVNRAATARPGTVIDESREGIDVACGEDILRIARIQLPGARAVTAADFLNAHTLVGSCLGAG
jgi:methionyl-tRNA formyltransferase